MVVSGFALPVALAHAGVIHSMACVMAMLGGGLVYGTSEFGPRCGRFVAARIY